MLKALISTPLRRRTILVMAVLLVPCGVLFSSFNHPHPVSAAVAGTSKTLNFQGRLLNTAGNLVSDGLYNIRFKIYNVPSAGSALWTDTRYDTNGVTAGNDFRINVVNGYFSVNLGDADPAVGGTAFSGIDWSQQLWLTMDIGGSTQTATPTYDGEMAPRIGLTATPLAFVANNVNSGNTNSASTNSNDVTIQSGNAAGTTSNSGNISIDAGTATGTKGTISLGATSASALLLGRTGFATTIQGGLTVTTGQNFIVNGDTFTDLTGAGLTVTGNALTVDATSATGFFKNGGNAFTATSTIGNTGNFDLGVITNNLRRLTVTAGGNVGIGTTAPVNVLSVEAPQYSTGTISQTASATVVGSGTTFTAIMVGGQIVYADGTNDIITAFTDATHVTVGTSRTHTSSAYTIYYAGLQVTNGGRVGIGTAAPGKQLEVLAYNDEQLRLSADATHHLDIGIYDNGDSTVTGFSGAIYFANYGLTSSTTVLADGSFAVYDNAGLKLIDANTSFGLVFEKGFYSGDEATVSVNSANALQIQNAASDILLNVDTTNSQQRLEVVGDIVSKGTSWTARTSAANNAWLSVTYGNGLFVSVACGVSATTCNSTAGNRVMTSPDGINWTARTSAANNQWTSVTYGNGLFVAVSQDGSGNRVMTSPDGINWTARTSAANNSWQSITYGNGLFVAVAYTGTGNRVMTSPDGINWTSRTSAADNTWISITYGNGKFVAVSVDGANRVMTSPDGVTWTSQSAAATNLWGAVTYGNGLFVAVSQDGSGNRVMTSPDGVAWTIGASAADNTWNTITYGNGLFVALSVDGSGNRVMTSPDGINWTIRTNASANQWYSVSYGNGMFAAISIDGSGNRVMTSGKADLTVTSEDTSVLRVNGQAKSLSVGSVQTAALFNPKADISAGSTPISIVSGDFNKDGKADLAAVFNGTTQIGVYFGTGNGNFSSATTYSTGSNAQFIVTADFNKDGNLDLAVSNRGGNTVSIFIGSAAGTFAAGVTYATGTSPQQEALGDFDNDGDIDIAVINNGSAGATGVTILINGGAGTFTAGTALTTNSTPNSITSGDFNKDGRIDLAVTSQGNSNISLFFSSGAGTFAAKSDLFVLSNLVSIATADVNGDTYLDLLVTNSSNSAMLVFGTGTNSFKSPAISYTGFSSSTPMNAVFADFNKDGDLDTILNGFNSSSVVHLLLGGASNGGFGTTKTDITAGTTPTSSAVADFNNDGNPDVAVANQGSQTISILMNSELGVTPSTYPSLSIYNNGINDILNVKNYTDSSVVRIDGQGNSVFGLSNSTLFDTKVDYASQAGPEGLANADFNRDGYMDFVESAGNGTSYVSVYLNNQDGTFAAKKDYQSGGVNPTGIATGDVDRDGDTDIIATNYGSTNVSVLFNNGGNFGTHTEYTVNSSPNTATVTDLDGDGDLDIVVTNIGSANISVLLNNGSGAYAAKVDYATGSLPRGLTYGDYDGDGDIDLAVANQSSLFMSVFLNNGNGTFATSVPYTAATSGWGISSGDLDGDGDLDIVLAVAGTTSVFLNNGNGTFASKVDYTGGFGRTAIADFDKDGDLDIVAAHSSSNLVSFFANNGNGTFASKIDYASGVAPLGMAAADYDNDGDVDLVIANNTAGTTSVFLNTTASNSRFAITNSAGSANVLSVDKLGSLKISQSVNSQSALQVQNSTGATVLNLDAQNNALTVGSTSATTLFKPKVDYTTGSSPNSLASADFNGDGLKDMVVANGSSTSISVYTNMGGAQFAKKTDYTTGTTPRGVTTGDFDRDGDIDIAVTNSGTTTVFTYSNNGNGTFAAGVTNTVGSTPYFIASVDVNKDGYLDLVIANNTSANVSVLINNGAGLGTFAATANYTVGTAPRSIAFADFDKDGNVDMAVANATTNNVSILTNTGSGTFNAAVNYSAGANTPSGIVAGDFDGDGDADFAIATANQGLAIFPNNGAGLFLQALTTYSSGGAALTYLAGADVNKDGKTDIVAASLASNLVAVYLGSGTGSFGNRVDYTTATSPTAVIIVDLNGDGGLELAVSNSSSVSFSVFVNAEIGVSPTANPSLNIYTDGAHDVLSVKGPGASQLLRVDGVGNFTVGGTTNYFDPKADYATSANPIGTVLADFNKDGYIDMATTSSSASVTSALSVYMGNSVGTYSGKTDYQTNNGAVGLAAGDLDKDGDIDMVDSSGGSTVSVYINNGLGVFAAKVDYSTTGTSSQFVAIADFNKDGANDIVVSNFGTANVSVFINLGAGTFGAAVTYTVGTNPNGLTTGDFDGDGDVDVAVANFGSVNMSIIFNGGAGTFGSATNYTTGASPYAVAAGDFNGDGDLDLAVVGGTSTVSVFINVGAGLYAAKVDYATTGSSRAIAAVDVNNDGFVDLITASTANNILSTFINTGTGTFLAKVDMTTSVQLQTIATADLDKDGDIDLAAPALTSNVVNVFKNNVVANSRFTITSLGGASNLLTVDNNGGLILQGAANVNTLNADTTVAKLIVNQATTLFAGGAIIPLAPTLAVGANTGGSLSGNGSTTYYYKITAVMPSGETIASTEIAINGQKFTKISNAGAPGGAAVAGAGLGIGGYTYRVTFVTSNGETAGGTTTGTITTTGGNQQINLTSIPLGATGTIARKIYRTAVGGGSTTQKYVTTINDNTTTTYSDTLADASLGLSYPTLSTATTNTNNVTVTFTSIPNAKNYRIYRGTTSGGENSYQTVYSSPFTDTGAAGTTANAPTNSSLDRVGIGNVSPTANLDVLGTVKFQVLQDSASALQVLNAAGDSLLAVDSLSSALKIGSVATTTLFAGKVDYAATGGPNAIATGDFNGDGINDMAVSNYGSARLSVYLNTGNGTFATKVDLTTGTQPTSVVAVDFDKDGDIDLATTNNGSGTVSTFLNNGDGTFATKVDLTASTNVNSLTYGDFDKDGDTDLAAVNYGAVATSGLYIFLNSGTGTFAAGVNYTTGTNPSFVTTGDFDRDGDLDLVVTNQGAATASIFINNGAAVFAAKVDYNVGTSPISATTGDFDRDGDIDVAVANFGTNNISVLLNSGLGSGRFGASAPFPTSKTDYASGLAPYSITSADFDKDGDIDVAVVNSTSSTASVYLNKGDGTYGAKTDYVTGSAPQGIATTDFDRDGDSDLVVANSTSVTVSVLINKVLGVTPTAGATISVYSAGINDAAAFYGPGNSQLFRVDGQGNSTIGGKTGSAGLFGPKTTYTTPLSSVSSVISADFNNDGNPDVATSNNSDGTVSVFLGNGTGSLGARSDYTVAASGSTQYIISVGDFNKDGYLDMVVAVSSASIMSILINNGNGTFAAKVDYTTCTNPQGSAVGDFNNDSKTDIVISCVGAATVSVFLNSGLGAGQFGASPPAATTKVDYTIPNTAYSVITADFNNDGKIDIATSNTGGTTVSVALNTGGGTGMFGAGAPTFASKVDYTVGTGPRSLVAADFNNDGKIDIAASNYGSNTMSILLNTGAGAYAAKVDYPTGGSPYYSVNAADFNKDGYIDLMTSDSSDTTVSVFLGTGVGIFGTRTTYSAVTSVTVAAVVDIDKDGDLDVVTGGTGMALMLNNTVANNRLTVMNSTGTSELLDVGNNGLVVNTTQTNNGNLVVAARPNSGGTTADWAKLSSPTAGTIMSGGTAATDGGTISVVYNGNLYVAAAKSTGGAEILRYDSGTSWTRVSQPTPGTIASGGTSAIDNITALIVYNGYLYAGTSKAGAAEVYQYLGGAAWTKVSQATAGTIAASGTTVINGIQSAAVYNGYLYMATVKANAAEVYRYDGGTNWTKVTFATAGTIVTGGTANIDLIDSMTVFNNKLYIGTNEPTLAEIYRYDGGVGNWTRVSSATAGTIATGGSAGITATFSMASYNGSLYAATGGGVLAEVYRYDGGIAWTKVTQATAGTIAASGTTAIDQARRLVVYNGVMFLSTYEPNGAEIYRYDNGTSWTKISQATAGTIAPSGTASIDGSWITSVYNDKMIVMTTETGLGEVYAFTSSDSVSYALQFQATSNNVATSTLFQNTAQITFAAEQATNASQIVPGSGSFQFSHGISTVTGAYDLAEDYPTRDDSLRAGDIVSIDPNEEKFVKKGDGASADLIVGVYSTAPALRLTQKDATIDGGIAVPIALAGRVPVKVSTENGSIHAGDPITISPTQPGVGVKAIKNGRIVGMSMGNYSAEGIGEVTVFINPSYYNLPVTDLIQSAAGNFGGLNTTGDAHFGGNLFVSGEATITELTVTGTAKFGGDIKVIAPVNTRAAIIRSFIASEAINPGQVVILDEDHDGQVKVSSEAGDTRVIGVAVTQAIEAGDAIEVATGGSVQVTTVDLGIKPGSLVVSSGTGSVEISTSPKTGSVLGKSTSKTNTNKRLWILITLQ